MATTTATRKAKTPLPSGVLDPNREMCVCGRWKQKDRKCGWHGSDLLTLDAIAESRKRTASPYTAPVSAAPARRSPVARAAHQRPC